MRKEDIFKAEAGELEEVASFRYVPGNICRLSLDDDETKEEIQDFIERSLCPRCEKPINEDEEFCLNCGARKINI